MTLQIQAQDLALNVLLKQQALDNVSAEIVMDAPRKLRVVQTSKEVPSTNSTKLVSVPGVVFKLAPGSYDAKTFMIAWRRCKNRDEQIQAMAGYTGYDNKVAFSVNEYNALSSAKKTLTPHLVTAVKSEVEGKGFVAGMPDNVFKKISDLLGREKMAAEALSNYELQIANLTEGSTEHLTAQGMAEIERERLVAIRADLSLLVK
jgi:hypothetical protein